AQRIEIEGRTNESRAKRQRTTEIFRFLGRIEQALENVQAAYDFGELAGGVRDLQERVAQLRAQIDPLAEKQRTENALRRIAALIARYLPTLDVENPNDPVFLDLKSLTVKVS